MAEQLGYPYIPGEKGIPFKDIVLDKKCVIQGASGVQISCRLTGDMVELTQNNEQGRLHATIGALVSEELIFDLRTKIGEDPNKKYPDFFAARFIDYTFQYFEARGHRINTVRSVWSTNSDNLKAYKGLRYSGVDSVLAANHTWTGRTLNTHGFQVKNPRDIHEEKDDGRLSFVMAMFRK